MQKLMIRHDHNENMKKKKKLKIVHVIDVHLQNEKCYIIAKINTFSNQK